MKVEFACAPLKPSSWFWSSIFILVFTASTVYMAPRTPPYVYARWISASIIILFLLGFVFIKMLFPEGRELDNVEKAALSMGVSLALIPLTVLILNYTPYGVNSISLLVTLSLLTILFAVTALVRQRENMKPESTILGCQVGFSLLDVSYFALPLVLAVCLRVYPFLLTGLPFSVDAWPSIKYAEVLLKHSPIHLGDEVIKGCDELGDRLFGSAISTLTGLQPLTAMAFFLPVTGAMSIPILYALTKKIYGAKVPLLASILLATAFTDIILTAGVKGETYAHPLYMLLIFLQLHKEMAKWKKVLLFSLAGASLVLTHYYTAILTSAILTSIGVAMLISNWKIGAKLEMRILILPSILALQVLAYLTFYANWALNFIFTIDWLSAASYQLVLFASALYLAFKPHGSSRKKPVITCASASLMAFTLALLATRRPLILGAPVLPMHYLMYAGPFISTAPLTVLGYGASKSLNSEHAILPLFWLATVLGLECFAIFGNVEPGLGLTLAYRGVNFLLPPLFIFSAVGLIQLLENRTLNAQRLVKASAVAILITILTLNIYAFYATIFMRERYMGYFWLHRIPEYKAGLWFSKVYSGETIAGDVKFTYLLRYYFKLKVDELQGLLYLSGKSRSKPEILLTYDYMQTNGYVLYGGSSVDLPENWMEKASELNLIYSNGFVTVYTR
ncbi:MAG: DUF1616 domain-containing protein [Nitrososphaerota archaeon]